VISAWLFSYGASALDHTVRKNPIAALKKNGFDSRRLRFFKACALITDWDRFARRKNCSNRDAAWPPLNPKNRSKQ
jgi:hypothetical protein